MIKKINMLDAMLHELKNPLTALSAISDMLDSSGQDTPKEILNKSIQTLGDSSREALEIVKRIESYSQSDLNNLEVKPERIEIINFLQKIIATITGRASLIKDIKVEFIPRMDQCYVNFTKDLFQLLVTNLMNNAIKHSMANNLTVSVEQVLSDAKRVQITFRDNGVGIPKHEKNAIFTPFKRGSNAQDSGSGIGLALVKQILETHDGDISVANNSEGKGACFVASLVFCS